MKTFVVLAMHRSATSLVSKAMNNEISMGSELMGAGHGNPLGHFEDMGFYRMNERILSLSGGSWHEPPPEENIIEVGGNLFDEISELVRERKKEHQLWGWKDPRTALTIRAYHEHLINPHYIAVYREPEEVAKSLQIRNNFSIEKGLQLTKEYNKRISKFIKEFVKI